MSDAVSRQYILDAFAEYIEEYKEVDEKGNHDPKWCAMQEAEMVVKEAPPAQPEPSTDIQDVLGYLDDVLHPLISPYNWNVYSELHDMISRLPSAQPNNDLQNLAEEIAAFKRCVKSENSDYLTGYLCALSAVEGMIAERRTDG